MVPTLHVPHPGTVLVQGLAAGALRLLPSAGGGGSVEHRHQHLLPEAPPVPLHPASLDGGMDVFCSPEIESELQQCHCVVSDWFRWVQNVSNYFLLTKYRKTQTTEKHHEHSSNVDHIQRRGFGPVRIRFRTSFRSLFPPLVINHLRKHWTPVTAGFKNKPEWNFSPVNTKLLWKFYPSIESP